jgi:hypothetical protein
MDRSVAETSPVGEEPPLPARSVEFDLTIESADEKHSDRSSFGPFIAIYASFGGFLALGGAWGLVWGNVGVAGVEAALLLVVGVGIVGLGIYGILWLGSTAADRLRIDESGITFGRRNGKSLALLWTDPQSKVDLCRMTGDREKVLPHSDARYLRPTWVDVWTTSRHVKLQTTVPPGALSAIVERARGRALRLSTNPVAFYSQSAPKSPGWLEWNEEGRVQPGQVLNGEVTKLRGSGRGPDT